MGYIYPALKPGINVEETPLLNSAGWVACSGIRFFQGMVQKGGGWNALSPTPVVGVARGMNSWSDLSGDLYLGIGTNARLEVFSGGNITDITPLYATDNLAPAFTTTAASTTVSIADAGGGAVAGDWVNIFVPVSVGGIVLQGFYEVVAGGNPFTVTAASPATSHVVGGGAVPQYATQNGFGTITTTLANHGLVVNSTWTVHVATTIANVTLPAGSTYTVLTVPTANTFTFLQSTAANASTSAFENAGDAQIQYLIHTGPVSAAPAASGGYGQGGYGQGPYGTASGGTATTPLRQWYLSNFGQDLIANYTGSPFYVWAPPLAFNSPALVLNGTNFPGAVDPPVIVTASFFASQQQQIIALGCDVVGSAGSVFDPLLVRWCDSLDFTDWAPTSVNQAGSYHIPSGSRLVGGVGAPQFNVIWTDVDMWLMLYLGGTGQSELVWGFNKVDNAPSLLSSKAVATLGTEVFFAAPNGFFRYNGNSFRPIPCTVWDKFWGNINLAQAEKVSAQANSYFREVSWVFPSASGGGECDQRVTVNIDTGEWTYEQNPQWIRTAWVDKNVYGAPAGIDLSQILQQHEVSNDANGMPLSVFAQTGWMAVSEGDFLTMVERLEADVAPLATSGAIDVTVYAQDYPNDPNMRTYGPYPFQPNGATLYSIVRARGKFIALEFSSSALGVFWRLGRHRYNTMRAGRCP